VWVYHVETLLWVKISAAAGTLPGRAGHSTVLVGRRLLVFGGGSGQRHFNDVWSFDVDTHVWAEVATAAAAACPPPARCAHAVLWLAGWVPTTTRTGDGGGGDGQPVGAVPDAAGCGSAADDGAPPLGTLLVLGGQASTARYLRSHKPLFLGDCWVAEVRSEGGGGGWGGGGDTGAGLQLAWRAEPWIPGAGQAAASRQQKAASRDVTAAAPSGFAAVFSRGISVVGGGVAEAQPVEDTAAHPPMPSARAFHTVTPLSRVGCRSGGSSSGRRCGASALAAGEVEMQEFALLMGCGEAGASADSCWRLRLLGRRVATDGGDRAEAQMSGMSQKVADAEAREQARKRALELLTSATQPSSSSSSSSSSGGGEGDPGISGGGGAVAVAGAGAGDAGQVVDLEQSLQRALTRAATAEQLSAQVRAPPSIGGRLAVAVDISPFE
jgi:hypothetical protein